MSGRGQRFLFAAYLTVVAALLFCRPCNDGTGYVGRMAWSLAPLSSIRGYLWLLRHRAGTWMWRYAAAQLFGNLALFAPFGWLAPGVFPGMRKPWRFLWRTALLIFLLETAQLLTLRGTFDVDDWILNLLGALAGWCLRRTAG